MTSNPLLLKTIAVFGLYWIIGSLIPGQMLSLLVSSVVWFFSTIVMLRYRQETWNILWRHKRMEGGHPGAHYAVMGIFLLALGSFYSSAFSLTWLIKGQPMDWLSTPYSRFGAFTMGCGFMLMFASPEASQKGMRIFSNWWIWLAAVAVGAMGFYAGITYRSNGESAERYGLLCPSQTPVVGSANGIYHVPGSRSYARTSPQACFADSRQARASGYRPAR